MGKVIFNYERTVNKNKSGVIIINESKIIIFMRIDYNIRG